MINGRIPRRSSVTESMSHPNKQVSPEFFLLSGARAGAFA